MDQQYHKIETYFVPVTTENWEKVLVQSIKEREQFRIENGAIYIGQVVVKFLGIPIDEDEYYNHLYTLYNEKNYGLTLLSKESLDKQIENRHFQSIQKLLNLLHDQQLSINRFVAFLDGEQLLLKSHLPAFHRKIREGMIRTLQLFSENEPDWTKSQDLRRVLVDLIKWSFNHLKPLIDNIKLDQSMPKFLWYGDFQKSHQYFLYYLMQLGCDIIIYHPNGEDIFASILKDDKGMFLHTYPNRKEGESFPTEKRMRKATVAYRASKEIETILNTENSGLYKPWQLRDYTPSSITLKTTYDELFLIMKEIAMIRPNFNVHNGVVQIPSVFAKIQGVSKNRKEYWDRMHSIVEREETLFIREFPFSRTVNNDFRFHYQNALGKDGRLVLEKMMNSNYWTYSHLPTGLQKGIAYAIQNVCYKPGLKPIYREKLEDLQIYLFTQGMHIPANIIQLLQKFDYSQTVPKLVLYNNELNGTLTRSDAAQLLLLNQFGIDIVLYNPSGHNDIENYIDESLYDIHWLEDVIFELEYKEPSILKKIFRHGLKSLRGE